MSDEEEQFNDYDDAMQSGSSSSKSALTGKEGVCRVEVARVEFPVTRPWQRSAQSKAYGTSFVIEGERLLTNAHVVRSAVDIRVRKHGSTTRYPARVVVYAPDVDLALLEINGEKEKAEFFGDSLNKLALEFATELPALRESVHVVGFPTGGTTICITEGIVSRIDLVSASSFNNILAIQIDASINPGNSGGPGFDANGLVTGVAFLKVGSRLTDNIGYLIPVDVVRTFLGRCGADGTYALAPSVPYRWHKLENNSLRQAHGVPDDVHGILVTSASPTLNGALQKGDVLTKIDGKPVADDGQVVLRGDELIQHRYLLRGKRVDEPTSFSIYRNGNHHDCPSHVLGDIPSICLRWADVDYPPDYLILGALVLLPLSWSLRSHKKCGTRLIGECIDWCKRWPNEWEGREGLVVLTDIFAHELSFSYSRPWRRVVAYNGVPVLSLKHLRDMWQESCAQVTEDGPLTFARIELESDDEVIFEVKAAMEAQAAILETNQIPHPFHISPPNPKYK